jgi:hypothetical protein
MLTPQTSKNIIISSIAGLLALFSCSTPTIENIVDHHHAPDKTERIDDSTVCYSFNVNDREKDMIYISKSDTIANVKYKETEVYENLIFYDKTRHIIKIKQCLRLEGIESRINESIYFKSDGTIDSSSSRLLFFELLGDSIRFHSDNQAFFNKTRILIGDNDIFDKWKWKNPIKFETTSSYLTIPNSFKGKKCLFQRITTDKKGRDESGYDIYFDTENIICRDIKKALVCFPENHSNKK